MPTLASTNRVQLTYKPEVVPGTPVSASAAYKLRMTGESLNLDLKKESDKEIRSDRQRTSSTTVGATVGGGVNVHMQFGEYDALFSALMQSDWATTGTPLGVSGTLATNSVATGTTAPVISGTGMPVLAKGQWFQYSHAAYTPTGGVLGGFILLRASSTVQPTATSITVDAGTPFNTATIAAGNAVIRAARLTNGTTMKSFTLEMQITDIAVPVYQTYKGMYVSKFSTTFNSGAMTDGSFDFTGLTMSSGTVKLLNATANDSLGFDVQNAVTGVGKIWEAGVPLTSTSIKSMSLSIDNSLRAQEAIGTLGAVGIGSGTLMVSGSLEIYFADGSLYNKFIADTYTSLVVSTQDPDGNGYVFTFPKVQLTSGKTDAGGKDSDLMASFNWEAFADTTNAEPALRQTMFIDRVGVAVTLPV